MTDRRTFLRMAIMGTAGLLVAGCDKISQSSWGPKVLGKAQGLNRRVQALLSPSSAMAKEYTEADISPTFHPNGTTMPDTPEYQALMANNFRDYKLKVTGLVTKPGEFSIDDLKETGQPYPDHPARLRRRLERHRQMAGHAIVGPARSRRRRSEGALRGVPLPRQHGRRHAVLRKRRHPGSAASADPPGLRPQRQAAAGIQRRATALARGSAARLQAGQVHRKHRAGRSFAKIGSGNGGYWEDQGYEWYAGI
jgi:DMSO/TMAO reductase YedYZ molybdopterin-dependent catalytic subunit